MTASTGFLLGLLLGALVAGLIAGLLFLVFGQKKGRPPGLVERPSQPRPQVPEPSPTAQQPAVAPPVHDSQFQLAIESSPDGFWALDMEGRILEVNEACCRLSGYTRQELIGRYIAGIDVNEDRQAVVRHIERIVERGVDQFETLHRRKDGRLWPVEVTSTYTPTGGGRFFAFLRDITDRRQAEAELAEQRLRAALDAATDGIWEWDLRTNRSYVTPAYCRMLGYEPGELGHDADSQFVGLMHPDDRARVPAEARRLLEQQGGYALEFRLRCKDGSYKSILSRGRVVERDAAGLALRAVGTHVDAWRRSGT
ncbi:MAG: PAS domain S-box protein [Gammaproteobacteria bacterium]|nr:PAS domain S-box protein [Gammaproteobacteria bacterium]